MRIILFAGKGGVGKTSLSAATGIKSAKLGYKTLVMSLDTAHSLSDSFDLDRGLLDKNRGQPVKVANNLWIQELDVQEEIEKNWGEVYSYISAILNLSGMEEILAEELAILPGMEEVSFLLHINRYARQKKFDVVVLDCAPTGESIRFISIPTALEWYMKKIFTLERQIARFARPIIKRVSTVPLPEDEYFQTLQKLFDKLEGVDRLLTNPEITSVRLVTNPEKMVVRETQRSYLYFSLYKVCIDAVLINRIFPSKITDKYFEEWKRSQEAYISQIEEYFSPLPVFKVKLFEDEILGTKDLAELAEEIYKDKDPTKTFYSESPYNFVKKDGRYLLNIKLPFITKQDIDLGQSAADELIVRIGSFKRHIPLPRRIVSSKPVEAKIEGQTLIISFGGQNEEREQKYKRKKRKPHNMSDL
jgi:arsenite-transporting ATPase